MTKSWNKVDKVLYLEERDQFGKEYDGDVDFSRRINSILDIFRRTDLKIFDPELRARLDFLESGAKLQTKEDYIKKFYSGNSGADEKFHFRYRTDILRSVMSDKTSHIIARRQHEIKGKTLSEKADYMGTHLKNVIDRGAFIAKSGLVANFKSLNIGIRNSSDYKISTHEVVDGIKVRLYAKDAELEENIRKKFLQEKIDLFYKLVREYLAFNRFEVIMMSKIEIIKHALKDRYDQLKQVDIALRKLKLAGSLTISNLTKSDADAAREREGGPITVKKAAMVKPKKFANPVAENPNDVSL
jgi:hypothetical protein